MADYDNEQIKDVEVGIIGGGSMGGGMTLLFSSPASSNSVVGFFDYDKEQAEALLKRARDEDDVPAEHVHGFSSAEKLLKAFKPNEPRIIVFSLPHGKPVDDVLSDLLPKMDKGDIIIDCGNEWYEDTNRRLGEAAEKGIHYIGCGVSGGYQAARRGPSMSAGGDKEAYDKVEHLLAKWAAKDKDGKPCVAYLGPGGSGNYVKMIHNGIEHAQLSILCEIWSLLRHQAGLSNDEIADIFESWNAEGRLSDNYLIEIGYKSLRFKKGDGIFNKKGVVEDIADKVVQDVDNTEGTGTWSVAEMATRHFAAPAMAASHCLRVISARRGERDRVLENLKVPQPKTDQPFVKDVPAFVEDCRKATYAGILGAFVQGLGIITKASDEEKWGVSLETCLAIWRAGCIVRSGGIADLLQPLLAKDPQCKNTLFIPEIAHELSGTYDGLKNVCRVALETDAVAPALAVTLDWLKQCGGKELPTNFQEMQMDYFGHHQYDLKSENAPDPVKGPHHTEFAPA